MERIRGHHHVVRSLLFTYPGSVAAATMRWTFVCIGAPKPADECPSFADNLGEERHSQKTLEGGQEKNDEEMVWGI